MPTRMQRIPAGSRVRGRSDETGSTLILALAFVTVILVLVTGLLALTHTGNRALRGYEIERTRRYSVNSAIEVSIQVVSKNPDLGTTAAARSCGSQYEVQGNVRVVGSGTGAAYVNVVCYKTPGDDITSGDPDTDGGQGARDVTFEVRCSTGTVEPYVVQPGFLNCGSGGAHQLLAKARVRFEVDPTAVYGTPEYAARATIPKVITWELRA